ncbi:MAG TPA: helix-turn-helix domain-containing protein [Jatrophihabitans sp.]|jgi:AcrR family transcriptional regulator
MGLRADATRNRTALIEAARAVFAEHGLDAPLDEVARRAGTGNATLYRRFPTRSDLIAAVFAERMAEHVEAVEAGLADDDPWSGFASYVKAAAAMQARDRGIADLVTMDVSAAPEIEALRSRAFDGLVRLVDRAHDAGVLRADFTTQDVVVLLMANAGLVERALGISAEASARLIHVLLDGFRAAAATDGPPPPSARRTELAMRRNGQRRLGAAAEERRRASKDPAPTTSPTKDSLS